jgi:hypothetical protein
VVFKILTQAEVVAYLRRNATIVCGAYEHIVGSCICLQDSKIQFNYELNITSAISKLANQDI